MELSVINYESNYYKQVLELRNKVLRQPLGMNLYDEDLREDMDQYIFIVLKEQVVVACLMLKILTIDTVKLRQMAVDPAFQGRGYGALLVKYAENFCVLNDYYTIELHARKEAMGFYDKLGYDQFGDEFEEVGIPHYLMVKQLPIHRPGVYT